MAPTQEQFKTGDPVRFTATELGVIDPTEREVFHSEITVKQGDTGIYAGPHPNLHGWHLIDVEIDGAKWQVPVGLSHFEVDRGPVDDASLTRVDLEADSGREVVSVGMDGASKPMLRYRDELHLPDSQRSIVDPADRPEDSSATGAEDEKIIDVATTLTREFHLEVIVALEKLGVGATFEHPGFVGITFGDGRMLAIGQHDWHYGTMFARDGVTDAGTLEVELPPGDLTPAIVAEAWASKISEGV